MLLYIHNKKRKYNRFTKEVSKMSKKAEVDKRMFKKSPEELQQYLHFKKRGFAIENKKGKGSFKRNPKHKNKIDF